MRQELEPEEPCFTSALVTMHTGKEEQLDSSVPGRTQTPANSEGSDSSDANNSGSRDEEDVMDKRRSSFSPSNSTLLADKLLSDELMAFRFLTPQTACVHGSQ